MHSRTQTQTQQDLFMALDLIASSSESVKRLAYAARQSKPEREFVTALGYALDEEMGRDDVRVECDRVDLVVGDANVEAKLIYGGDLLKQPSGNLSLEHGLSLDLEKKGAKATTHLLAIGVGVSKGCMPKYAKRRVDDITPAQLPALFDERVEAFAELNDLNVVGSRTFSHVTPDCEVLFHAVLIEVPARRAFALAA
jgi:hypothetical protein